MSSKSNSPASRPFPKPMPRRGATAFALLVVALGLVLAAQITTQTKWIDGLGLLQQPRFWPAICLIGICLFAGLNLVQCLRFRTRPDSADSRLLPPDELFNWLKPIEFVAYFMIYVFAVPELGYLPATVIFCPLIAFRVGHRRPRDLIAACLFAVTVVVVFRSLLQVKLPSGRLYEIFPDAVRNFLISYF